MHLSAAGRSPGLTTAKDACKHNRCSYSPPVEVRTGLLGRSRGHRHFLSTGMGAGLAFLPAWTSLVGFSGYCQQLPLGLPRCLFSILFWFKRPGYCWGYCWSLKVRNSFLLKKSNNPNNNPNNNPALSHFQQGFLLVEGHGGR